MSFEELQGQRQVNIHQQMLKRCIMNLIYEIIFFTIIASLFYAGRHEDCYIGINSFSKIALFIKGGIVIPITLTLTILMYFHILNVSHLEIISSMLAVPSSGWFCYVTSLYFNKENTWKIEAHNLFYMHSLLTLEALWFFFKLFMIVIILSGILLTMCAQNYLNSRSSNQRKKSVKEKIFGRESLEMSFSKIESDEFWVIWMETYK